MNIWLKGFFIYIIFCLIVGIVAYIADRVRGGMERKKWLKLRRESNPYQNLKE